MINYCYCFMPFFSVFRFYVFFSISSFDLELTQCMWDVSVQFCWEFVFMKLQLMQCIWKRTMKLFFFFFWKWRKQIFCLFIHSNTKIERQRKKRKLNTKPHRLSPSFLHALLTLSMMKRKQNEKKNQQIKL